MGLNLEGKRVLVLDSEANGLSPTEVWCICTTDLQTGEKRDFDPDTLHKFGKYQQAYDYLVCHNGIGYDRPKILNNLLKLDIPLSRILDTYVMSKLSNPVRKVKDPITGKIISGHSVKAYGLVYGLHKQEFEDWSMYTYEMLQRCRRDTDINVLIFRQLVEELKDFSHFSIMLEHRAADETRQLMDNGVYFDVKTASILRAGLSEESGKVYEEVVKEYPPRPVPFKVVEPSYNKDGSLRKAQWKWYSDDPEVLEKDIKGPVTRFVWEDFNLGSHKQIVQRMNEIGWKPVERTKGALQAIRDYRQKKISKDKLDKILELGWQTSEANLETIPDDAPQGAKKISRWKMLSSRVATIDGWLDCVGDDNRIHGYIDSLGAVTSRKTHDNPNLANIVASHKPYGGDIRSLFTVADPGRYCLVGQDSDAIQFRLFAHLIDDKELIYDIENGDKKLGTDPHTKHSKLLNHKDRDTSKTWIYAFLFGAQPPKLATISGRDTNEETHYYHKFLERYPQIEQAKKQLMAEYKRYGKIRRLDGGWCFIRRKEWGEPALFNSYCQSNESVIMKMTQAYQRNSINKEGLDAKLVLDVHDEHQWESLIKHSQRVGELGQLAHAKVGEKLKLGIKIMMNYKCGPTWKETH